jgi:hypothetical protein
MISRKSSSRLPASSADWFDRPVILVSSRRIREALHPFLVGATQRVALVRQRHVPKEGEAVPRPYSWQCIPFLVGATQCVALVQHRHMTEEGEAVPRPYSWQCIPFLVGATQCVTLVQQRHIPKEGEATTRVDRTAVSTTIIFTATLREPALTPLRIVAFSELIKIDMQYRTNADVGDELPNLNGPVGCKMARVPDDWSLPIRYPAIRPRSVRGLSAWSAIARRPSAGLQSVPTRRLL